MNKKIYLLPILLLALVFTSCEETKEVSRYDNWQARNEAFIDSLYMFILRRPIMVGWIVFILCLLRMPAYFIRS